MNRKPSLALIVTHIQQQIKHNVSLKPVSN